MNVGYLRTERMLWPILVNVSERQKLSKNDFANQSKYGLFMEMKFLTDLNHSIFMPQNFCHGIKLVKSK